MSKPRKVERSITNNLPQSQARDEMNYKYNNKKRSNKDLCCPFACPNCQSLGRDLVKTKYEIINILSDNSESIFSPMHEQYHDDDGCRGQIFISETAIEEVVNRIIDQQKRLGPSINNNKNAN
jgi:hypothetical protein